MRHRCCQDLPADDVRGELEQQRVPLSQPSAGQHLIDGQPPGLEGLDHPPCAERRRFQQRPVDLVRLGRHREPDQQAGQTGIDQRGPASIPPVQGQHTCLTRPQPSRLRCQSLVRRVAGADVRGNGTAHEPLEDIADRRLARLVAKQPGHNAVLDHPRNPGNREPAGIDQQVTGRRAHDGHHLAGLCHADGRHPRMCIDHRDGDRGAGMQAGASRPRAHQSPGLPGHWMGRSQTLQPLGQGGIEAAQECGLRVAGVFLPVGFVPRLAGTAHLSAGQLPDDPVSSFDPAGRGTGHRGRLCEHLPPFRPQPFRRGLPAVELQKRTAGAGACGVDAVGIGLRGVMFPQLRPGVRVAGKVRLQTQRRALGGNRQHRARRAVDPEADDVIGVCVLRHRPQQLFCGRHPVPGMLQRPVRRKVVGLSGEAAIDHAVGERHRGRRGHAAAGHVDQHGAGRIRSKVDPDGVLGHRRGKPSGKYV